MRNRSAMLEGLEVLRDAHPEFTLNQVVCLLHIADEGEPLPLPDLRRRAGLAPDVAWKSVNALTEIEFAPGEPLASMRDWVMPGIVAAELTPAGARLTAILDDIIRAAHPIELPPAKLASIA
jgi:hypothetical protein